ncbi:hypothetical protein [Agreia bicolorata]|uniref:Lipoprotein n=1 Tax=Agreia bicolorata TaxID=110935 RepID=A0ABR5CDU7_9MICO|nr:hypothetical protein [Agreia bicolorata]KJC63810.1 hypothetical protein TZ00_12280 [Agreia bicolorata]
MNRKIRVLHVVGIAVAAQLLVGCAGSPAPASEPTPTATPTSTSSAVSAAESCDQFGDVETTLHNARTSFREGRTSQQEYSGATRLAARILSRIPSESGTDVGDALTALQSVAPAAAVGVVKTSFDPDGPEWSAAVDEFTAACKTEGAEVAVSAWTGG